MKSKLSSALAFSFTCAAVWFANGWISANDGAGFERAGLVNEWFTQIEVGARSDIVNMELQINEDLATRFFLVEYGGNVERISQFELDAFGNERGIEGAEEWANIRKEIVMAELAVKRRNDIPVTVRPITLPKSTIYTVTTRGRVIAVDADTGEHRWHTTVGNPKFRTAGVGSSKTHVAVVNGSTVYCLSAAEGKILWQRDCNRAPSAPPSVGAENIYVPLINGRLEVFSIEGKGKFSKSFLSFGASNSQPLLTSNTVSWATKDGYYAVAPYRARAIQFRLNTGNSFVGAGADGQGKIFVNTVGGSIFALDEASGSVLWEYSTGDRIRTTPFVRDGCVFCISIEDRLYRIDAERGLPTAGWEKPIDGVSKYVGMSQNRIYVLDSVGNLVALDPNTGAKVASVPGRELSLVLPNVDSDRIYVGHGKGSLRCYREAANTYPVFHADLGELLVNANRPVEQEPDPAEEVADEDDPFASSEEDDPFATTEEEDPFASGDESSDEDPFGGSDDGDPFGGSSDEGDDDPFGGGGDDKDDGDPFGGDSGGGDDGDDDPFGHP